jgi:hypothetical protein
MDPGPDPGQDPGLFSFSPFISQPLSRAIGSRAHFQEDNPMAVKISAEIQTIFDQSLGPNAGKQIA